MPQPEQPHRYEEDDLLPIAALQHLLFCERQCALIHTEQVWADNRLTAEGRILHERVHAREAESRADVRTARGLRIRSLLLGLTGQADVVEFRAQADGSCQPFPIEHKRGRPKMNDCDRVQLCAQALCLEEMLHVAVPRGAIFYASPRRREYVDFTTQLRQEVREAAARLRILLESRETPAPVCTERCDSCSILDACTPRLPRSRGAVERYLQSAAEGV